MGYDTMNVKYLKQMISPIDLAQRTLGNPVHKKGYWYKSPFRTEERTASFEVTENGFHDFGTGKHYDIIAFMQRLYNCSFKEAVEKLSVMYGLTENEYETESMRRYLEEKRLAMNAYKEKVENWYYYFFDLVEKVWDDNEACIQAVGYDPGTLAILYDRQIFLGCLREELFETQTFEEKERLRAQITKEGIPEWMRDLENYFLIQAN
jgi:DNA primase